MQGGAKRRVQEVPERSDNAADLVLLRLLDGGFL